MGLPCDPEKFEQSIEAVSKMLCPGGICLHMARIDTKANYAHKSVYDADRMYFLSTRQSSFIRESYCGEFDHSPSSSISAVTYPSLNFQTAPLPNEILKSVWKDIPRLWVLVADHGEGVHHVSTIYRGDAMWTVEDREGIDTARFDTPEGLPEALAQVQEREGFDEHAWKRFVAKYWDAAVLDAAIIETKGMAVH